MKNWLAPGLALLLIALTGCTPMIYGVPQDRWNAMNQQERVAAMDAYRARQAVLLERQKEYERQMELERERQQAIAAEKERQRRLRVEAIYRGQGVYGDLLRVTIAGGSMRFYGSHKPYQQVAFRIAAGETKTVRVFGPKGRAADLVASYDGSNLLLDEGRGGRSRSVRLVYDRSWERGRAYRGLSDKGPLELREVTVRVEVLGEPPRGHHFRNEAGGVVVPKEIPRPVVPRAIIIDNKTMDHRQPEPVVIIKEPPPTGGQHVAAPRPPHRTAEATKPPQSEPKAPPHRAQSEQRSPARVEITLSQGTIVTRGKASPITPQSFGLREGEVRTVTLRGRLGTATIRVSYRKGEIVVEEGAGRGKPAASYRFGQKWRAGETYRFKATRGRVIQDLEISTRAQ